MIIAVFIGFVVGFLACTMMDLYFKNKMARHLFMIAESAEDKKWGCGVEYAARQVQRWL